MKNQISNLPRNARFWSLENGSWVKLTVKPGAVLRWSRFSRDGEGWSFEANAWEHMDGYVQLDWIVRGADCDGRTERAGSCTADVERLAVIETERAEHNGAPITRPDWRELGDIRCRDEFAEAAGY